MDKALRYMFWGYLFIFFRVHIGFDWLADPVGYYLIYSGCFMLIDKYPHAKKAGIVAGLGIVISFPAIFVNLSAPYLGIWEVYSLALLVLKLIVAYFLFAVLKSIVNDYANQALINQTKSVYTFYIAIHLSVQMLMSFSMNIAEDQWITLTFMLTMGALVMDIMFLLLLAAIRQAQPRQTAHDYSV
ncbi:hypothetical protein [Sporosarcina sp. FA15]|uniref:hypothetical protein n=1 Tax=Sporosarcina sp. FA15 TaxID=3413031 RepID=UPI003F65845C